MIDISNNTNKFWVGFTARVTSIKSQQYQLCSWWHGKWSDPGPIYKKIHSQAPQSRIRSFMPGIKCKDSVPGQLNYRIIGSRVWSDDDRRQKLCPFHPPTSTEANRSWKYNWLAFSSSNIYYKVMQWNGKHSHKGLDLIYHPGYLWTKAKELLIE